MVRNPDPITISDLVRRAVEAVDPDNDDPAVAEFEQRFEDADEPATGFENLEERIGFGADDEPAVTMAQAIVLYLAHRRDMVDDDPADESLLGLAARAEFDGDPPQPVADWLADRGVRV
jgi:hypothetical protein